MTEDKKIRFKAQMKQIGSSKYVLVPSKLLQFEDLADDTVFSVEMSWVESND